MSVFTVHLEETLWTHLYNHLPFSLNNSSRHDYIIAIEIRCYNANS